MHNSPAVLGFLSCLFYFDFLLLLHSVLNPLPKQLCLIFSYVTRRSKIGRSRSHKHKIEYDKLGRSHKHKIEYDKLGRSPGHKHKIEYDKLGRSRSHKQFKYEPTIFSFSLDCGYCWSVYCVQYCDSAFQL